MGACASTQAGGQQKGTHDPQSRSGVGKVFSLEVHAGLKGADAQQRQPPESPAIAACPPAAKPHSSSKQKQQLSSTAGGSPASSQASQLSGILKPTTRACRLSFTGPCGATAAAPNMPAAPNSSSSTCDASTEAPDKASADISPRSPALGAQPQQPAGHPLPERRVRFSDSPEKTRGRQSEGEEAAGGSRPDTPARPHSRFTSLPSASAAAAAPAAANAAAAAFAAAEARIRSSLAAGQAAGSPSKAAVMAAVPMADLIHSVASLSRAGREPSSRKTNQDNCFCYREYCRPNQALLAALDGHGPNGHLVSDFLRAQLPLVLAEQLGEKERSDIRPAESASTANSSGSGEGTQGSGAADVAANIASSSSSSNRGGPTAAAASDTSGALTSAFLRADEALRLGSGVNVAYSGSTAVLCMLQGRRLTTAWVGDSKAVLARQEPRGCRAVCLTRDHKPHTPDERARICASGGRVERLVDHRGQPVGPQRVWLANSWVPGLAMSRALGDVVAHTVGVLSEPETSVVELCPQDKWLLLATDGVWEFVDPQMAVDIVSNCRDAEDACRTLVDVAWSKWLEEEEGVVDDITVVAVRLNP